MPEGAPSGRRLFCLKGPFVSIYYVPPSGPHQYITSSPTLYYVHYITSLSVPEGEHSKTCFALWASRYARKSKAAVQQDSPLVLSVPKGERSSSPSGTTKADDAIYAFLFVPFGEQHLKVQYARSSALVRPLWGRRALWAYIVFALWARGA